MALGFTGNSFQERVMRTIIVAAILLVFSSGAIAQNMPAGVQEAMKCMQSIDQEAIKDLSVKAKEISLEIKALCKKGDESGARVAAMHYAKGIKDNKILQQLNKCSDMMRKAMPNMPAPDMPSAKKYEDADICAKLK